MIPTCGYPPSFLLAQLHLFVFVIHDLSLLLRRLSRFPHLEFSGPPPTFSKLAL